MAKDHFLHLTEQGIVDATEQVYRLCDPGADLPVQRKDSIYYMGKRSSDWIKCKRMADKEFIVAGYLQKGKHIFSLILAKYMKNFLIYKGHVTAGVTRDIIEKLTITDRSPFPIFPVGHEKAVWVKPDYVCVVEYMPNTLNSLRQPVFKGFRLDVLPEEVAAE